MRVSHDVMDTLVSVLILIYDSKGALKVVKKYLLVLKMKRSQKTFYYNNETEKNDQEKENIDF